MRSIAFLFKNGGHGAAYAFSLLARREKIVSSSWRTPIFSLSPLGRGWG